MAQSYFYERVRSVTTAGCQLHQCSVSRKRQRHQEFVVLRSGLETRLVVQLAIGQNFTCPMQANNPSKNRMVFDKLAVAASSGKVLIGFLFSGSF